MPRRIVIIGTMDTKGPEMRFIAGLIGARGHQALLMDVGIGDSLSSDAGVSRDEVLQAAGTSPEEIRSWRRDRIMATMARGAALLLQGMYHLDQVDGVIGLGGNQGTAIAALAMQALPIGFPRVLVSTVASGNIRPYIGYQDIAMIFSVSDLLGGTNALSRVILSKAAGAILGMVETTEQLSVPQDRPVIAITAFGNTNQAVTRALELLTSNGYETITFHASGACGSAMEELIGRGLFAGVLDLTTHELLGELYQEDIYAPVRPGRLEEAVRRGIPLVVAPGGLDYFCFGGVPTIPPRFRGRAVHYHNPFNTNVRTTAVELTEVARLMAEKLNQGQGPITVLVPLRGWSENGRKGGPLHDPEADGAFVAALKGHLTRRIKLQELDANINDPVFAETAVRELLSMLSSSKNDGA